jgi:hypothetical protein
VGVAMWKIEVHSISGAKEKRREEKKLLSPNPIGPSEWPNHVTPMRVLAKSF